MPIEFTAVSLDSIDIEIFPDIALYVRQGSNYILYKNSEVSLTSGDIKRLQSNKVEFVYAMGEHAEAVQAYLEKNLVQILSNQSLSPQSRNAILCPMLLNYISDVFKNPEQPESLGKCKQLLQQLVGFLTDKSGMMDLLSKIALHDGYLMNHSAQVAILSMYMHQMLFDVDHDEIVDVGVGGILHDIGMLQVSCTILGKADSLSKSDYQRVKHHPRYSHDTLLKMGVTESIPLSIALGHHERFNGTGYPDKLSGNDISRSALVAGICDVYCALTMDRPYRRASTNDEALKTMKEEKRLFHPAMFEAFCAMMGDL